MVKTTRTTGINVMLKRFKGNVSPPPCSHLPAPGCVLKSSRLPSFLPQIFPKHLTEDTKTLSKPSKRKSPRRTAPRRLRRSYLRAGWCQVRRRTRDETRWSSYSAQDRRGCCVIARTRRCAAQERRKSRRDASITGRDNVLHKSSLAFRKYYTFIATANVVVYVIITMTSRWPFMLGNCYAHTSPTEVFNLCHKTRDCGGECGMATVTTIMLGKFKYKASWQLSNWQPEIRVFIRPDCFSLSKPVLFY